MNDKIPLDKGRVGVVSAGFVVIVGVVRFIFIVIVVVAVVVESGVEAVDSVAVDVTLLVCIGVVVSDESCDENSTVVSVGDVVVAVVSIGDVEGVDIIVLVFDDSSIVVVVDVGEIHIGVVSCAVVNGVLVMLEAVASFVIFVM